MKLIGWVIQHRNEFNVWDVLWDVDRFAFYSGKTSIDQEKAIYRLNQLKEEGVEFRLREVWLAND